MAKRQLIWSQVATIKLFEILDYFRERNGSDVYSKKLYKKLVRASSVLPKQPYVGVKTDYDGIRALIVENYFLFYEHTDTQIIIHTVWDSRQNPNNLNLK